MTRRNGGVIKYIVIGIVCIACLYGFYAYHDLHTRLKGSEEKVDRLRQQHDSVSAQLQVVYEHKNRLESSLQKEKTDHQKTKDDLHHEQTQQEARHESEKNELMGRIDSINQENKMLQGQLEDQQNDNSKLKQDLGSLKNDVQQKDTQHNEEYVQFKQEKEFEVGKLKDEVSNLARKNQDLLFKLEAAVKGQGDNQQQLQSEIQLKLRLQEEVSLLKGQLNQQQQNLANIIAQNQQQQQQQNNQGLNQQQNNQGQNPQHHVLQENNLGSQVQQNVVQQQQQNIANVQPQNNAIPLNPQQNVVHQPQDQHQGGQAKEQQHDSMQIQQPGEKKPYFEPKVPESAQNAGQAQVQQANENDSEGGKVVNEQVAAPKLQNNGYVQEENRPSEFKERKLGVDALKGPLQRIDQGGINQLNPLEQNPIKAPAGNYGQVDDRQNVIDKAKEIDIALQKGPMPNINLDKAAENMDNKNSLDNNDNVDDKPRLIGQGLRGDIGKQNGDNGFNRDQQKFAAPQGVGGDDIADEDDHHIVEEVRREENDQYKQHL